VQTIGLQHPTRFRLPGGMKDQGLQYYMHDESDALRFELAGRLSNGGAQSVYQAWQTALSILGDRTAIATFRHAWLHSRFAPNVTNWRNFDNRAVLGPFRAAP
jgi:hypothetical protein